MRSGWISSVTLPLTALLFAGCASLAPQPAATQGVELHLTFHRASGVQAQYVSSGTEGLSLQVGNSSAVDYSLSSGPGGNCTTSSGVTTCQIRAPLAPGSYPLTVKTYDTSSFSNFTASNLLSYATEQVTILPGQMNQLSLTLGAVVASAQLTPLNSDLILTTYNSSTPSSVTNYDLAAAETLPETFTLTLLDASGSVILQSAAGVPQVTLCASDPGELSVTPAGSGEYQLRALHPFGSNPSSAQSLYLAVGNCSGSELTRGSSTPISLPTVSETQALYVSNDGSNAITAYTAHGRELGFKATSGLNYPYGLAYDPVTGWLYAANNSSNTITAYDPSTGAEITTGFTSPTHSDGLNSPAGLAYDPQTGWLYAANYNGGTNGTITAYDPSTGAQVPSSSFSATSGLDLPRGLAFDPQTGWLYAANNGNTTITAYDPATGAQVPSSTSPFSATSGLDFPYGLAYDPQTGWLYAANNLGSTITAYNAATGAQVPSSTSLFSATSGLSNPEGLAFDPVTGWLYAANLNGGTNGTITAYDPSTGAEISSTSFTSPTSSDGISNPTFLTAIP